MGREFMLLPELANKLGVSECTIRGHLQRKNYSAVPCPIKMGRRLVWRIKDVDNWIEKKVEEAAAEKKKKKRGRPTKASYYSEGRLLGQ